MGLQNFTVKESVSPYHKAVVATTSAQDECRAIYVKTAGNYTLTINGTDIAFDGLLQGHIYPLAITKSSSANVILLY